MTIQIRTHRPKTDDRFPMVGFTIRASDDLSNYEVAVASDPALFGPNSKAQRNRNNFYSSRAQGPLPMGRDEAVFVLPPEVLVRFIGQPKLYFAVAGYNGAGPAKPEIGPLPSEASPYIDLSGLSGRSLRRVRVLPSRQRMEAGYGVGNGAELEWAGDVLSPGLQPVAAAKPNGKTAPGNPAPSNPTPGNPAPANAAVPSSASAAAAKTAALAEYNDGFGLLPPASPPAAGLPQPNTSTPNTAAAASRSSQAAADNAALQPENAAHPTSIPTAQQPWATNHLVPPHHAKRPYGSAVDPRAAALRTDIPLGKAFDADPLTLDIKYRMFIPSPAIDGPTGVYAGDGRGFSYDGGTSRGEIHAAVKLNPDGGVEDLTLLDRHWGRSLEYVYKDTIHPEGKPDWWREPVGAAQFLDTATLKATDDNLSICIGNPKPGVLSPIFPWAMREAIAKRDNAVIITITAAGALPLSSIAPDIDADLSVLLRINEGVVQARVMGAHDGFPAYELYVNRQRIYSFDPVAAGNSPKALLPPMDVDASTDWTDISPLATSESLALSDADEAITLADRLGPNVKLVVGNLLAQGVSEQDLSAFLRQLQSNETSTPQGLAVARGLAEQERAITIPPVQTLDGWRAKIVLTIVLTALGGPMGTTAALALPEVATRYRVCFGIGPGLGAGLLEGGSLSCGIVVAPDGKLGVFGRIEQAIGTLSGVSAALQVTITKGDLDHFSGSGYAVGLDIGDIAGFGVAGGATLLDENRHFHGVSVRLGVGLEAQPVELYLATERTYATSQGLAAGTRPHKAHSVAARAHALDAASVSVNWDDLELVPQPTDTSCWAAAAAMVVGWQDQVSLSPEKIAEITHRTAMKGLPTDDFGRFASEIGLVAEPPQCYSVDGFRGLLEVAGPLWVGVKLPSSGHAIVVTGMYGDGAADGSGAYVRITDPWDRVVGSPGAPGSYLTTHNTGSRYILSWADFTQEYEGLATTAPDGTVNAQILHASSTAGRTPNRLSPPAGYAMTAAAADFLPSPPPRRKVRAQEMDAGVIEIASAIAGAAMTRVINGDANITWELDQLNGLKHPNDQAPSPLSPFRDAPTIRLKDWPYVEALDGDRISADFTVDWQYNGTSLGNIRVSNVGTNGAILWKLKVKAQIMNDAILYPKESPRMAALRLRVYYQFTRAIGSDFIAVTDMHLFGDGSYDLDGHWEQN